MVEREIPSRARRLVTRLGPPILIGLVPALLLSFGIARFMLNHFFARAPYLLDSGLLSGIAYRAGLDLAPPQIACSYATSFYQVYFSPIISVFSGLSYLVPTGRMEWFAVIEAVCYFPVGIAVYAVASRTEPTTALRRLPCTVFAALAFAFSGLVLWTVGYPHYEIAMSGLICLVLVSVVTGRRKLTWLFVGLAASVRQDGGAHIALALAPVLYLCWRGVAMTPNRRRLIIVISVALGTTVLGFVLQKLLVVPVDRLRPVYFGTPAYAHLGLDMLVDRARGFVATCQVIYYPFLATVLLSIIRRDARYLLGWAVTLPWFIFNFSAYDAQKAAFVAYTVGPFIVAMFWVYVYGALLAPPTRRLRAGVLELVFGLICVASTLGMHRSAPDALRYTIADMSVAQPKNRPAVHAFVKALHDHRANLGKLYVDAPIAALALEWLDLADHWQPNVEIDTLVVHREAISTNLPLLSELMRNQLDYCTQVIGTGIILCTHDRLAPEVLAGTKTETFPSVFALSHLRGSLGVRILDTGVVFREANGVSEYLGSILPGTYDLTLELSVAQPIQSQTPGTTGLATLEIVEGNKSLATTTVPIGSHSISVRFTPQDPQYAIAYRFRTWIETELTITSARLRPATPAPAPAAR